MWPKPADLVTFTEEILDEKLHFLCSASHLFEKVHSLIGFLNVPGSSLYGQQV